MGLHTWLLSCTVDSVVKGIETILSKIPLSVSRPYCYKRKLEHMNWAKSHINDVCISALVIWNIISYIYEGSVDGKIKITISDKQKEWEN